MPRLRDPRIAVALAVLGLAAWSCWQRWQLLASTPFPVGVDGYFYPLQLRALLETGHLAYPAAPLAFYLLAPFAAVTDPITGAKLGAAVYGALIAVPAYGVGKRLGGSRGAGLIAAALATTSAGSEYLSLEFVKNAVGLTVALGALWLVLRALDERGASAWQSGVADAPAPGESRHARVVAAVLAIAAAYATHKMAAAMVIVVAVPAVLARAAAHGALRGRRLLIAVAGLVALALIAIVVGAAAPERLLSPRDLGLVRGIVAHDLHFDAPTLITPQGALAIGHDALLGLALAALCTIAIVVRRHRARKGARPPQPGAMRDDAPSPRVPAAGWPILGLALAIGLPFLGVDDREGLGFRLRLAAFVPAALTAAIACRLFVTARLSHGLSGARRDFALAALALVLVIARPPSAQVPSLVVHPALVSAAQALRDRVPPDATLIVPERHIAFLVGWYTRAPVALRPERIPAARRYRLLTLHFIGQGTAVDRQLIAARATPGIAPPLGLHPLHPNGLVLVAEPTWDWLLAHVPDADRARLAEWPTI